MKRKFITLVSILTITSALAGNLPCQNSFRTLSPHKGVKESGRSLLPGLTREGIQMTGENIQSEKLRLIAATKSGDLSSIEGTWTFQFGDYYFQDSILGSIFVNYEATVDGDYVYFVDETNSYYPFRGVYSPETQLIVFSKEYLGPYGKYFGYQEPFEYNSFTDTVELSNIYCFYSPDTGILEFLPDTGMAWSAFSDEEGKNFVGYFDMYDIISGRQVFGNNDDSDNWTYIGEAEFVDGWLLPSLGLDQTNLPYNVPLEQNKENPDIYRLVDPYHIGPMASFNEAQNIGYIVFDVTDPDHVVFNQADSGFASAALYVNRFYCYNRLGTILLKSSDGLTVEEIIASKGNEIPYTTFKDGVVSLGYVTKEDGTVLYDANFGYDGDALGGYCWTDVSMVASITFPSDAGIESISDSSNANTNIYNLQGLKMTDNFDSLPKGVYIVKGKKVFKR